MSELLHPHEFDNVDRLLK